jgi:hypothetical protein
MHRFLVGLAFLSCLLTAATGHTQERGAPPTATLQRSTGQGPIMLPNDKAVVTLDPANMQTGWILGLKQDTRFDIRETAFGTGQEMHLEITADQPRALTWSPKFGDHYGFKLPDATPEPDDQGRPVVLALRFVYHPWSNQWDLLAKTLGPTIPKPPR